MAPNIREIWNRRSGRMVDGSSRGSLPRFSQVPRTTHRRMNDDEAHPRHHRRIGLLRAAARGAGPRDDGGRRDDDHRSGGRLELQHDERRVRPGPQGMRPGVRQSGRAPWPALERRYDVFAGELEAGRSAELEAPALRGDQGEGDGHASPRQRPAHHRDQDGLGRVLMRRVLGGGAALLLALIACRPPAPRFTLLFLGRSPAASLGGLSWAPDPEHGRLVAFDGDLRVTRWITNPRLATPMAVTPLGRSELLVTERTGEGVVVDTAGEGRVVREWESPDVASLYAAGAGRVAATRSPYYVPQLSAPEPDTAPLIRMLDTLGRPTGGLATIRRPATPLLDYVVNAGAVAVGPDGAVYYAPLVRDEIRKYTPGGQVSWTTKRGLFRGGSEPDPEFLPAKGADLRLKKALVNVALAVGPPPGGRLYALGSDDSAATRLRVDVLDPATGAILATRHLGARETAVAVDASGVLAVFDADSLVARADGAAPSTREAFGPALALPDLAGDTVRLAAFRGKVTLVNFWASWCDPCREEFPHMAELYREFDRKDFEIAGVSDDVDSGPMLAFVRKYRPPFPILVGGGRMKQLYHYRGLPYSVLLDRQGRVIERIFGFGGAEEFRRLRQTIANEVRAP